MGELKLSNQPVADEREALERQAAVNTLHAIISGPGDLHAAARRVHDAGYRAALSAPAAGQDVSALVEAGNPLSNAAYNFAQQIGHRLTNSDCELLGMLRERWDAALAAHKAGGVA